LCLIYTETVRGTCNQLIFNPFDEVIDALLFTWEELFWKKKCKRSFFFFQTRALCLPGMGQPPEPLCQPFFVLGSFEIGSQELFGWDWLQTMILLISASGVARIVGVSH
jgi:hypothetical protein